MATTSNIHEPTDSSASAPTGKKALMLQSAAQVFLQQGYSGATTDMIQREAGVSESTMYAHCPDWLPGAGLVDYSAQNTTEPAFILAPQDANDDLSSLCGTTTAVFSTLSLDLSVLSW